MQLNITHVDDLPIEQADKGVRYEQGYHWVDVYFDAEAARSADHESEDFQRGASWYASYRWLHGNHNSYLDDLIDLGEFKSNHISMREYQLYYRVWAKRLRSNGW